MTLAVPVLPRKKRSRRRPAHPHPGDGGRHAGALLRWYDVHRRVLPWRAPPGATPDPYRVWLSEVMLQQTTVKAVAPYFLRVTGRWPGVHALAQAPLDEVLKLWAGLGYYARARNLHACAIAVAERHGGCFPRTEAELAALPGIGTYTAAAIAAIAFSAPAAAIDGNGERVLARYFAVEEQLPAARRQIRRLAKSLLPATRCGDFAQALMDLGAIVCTPKKPACMVCPWAAGCLARRRGDPEAFPRKRLRRQGELRSGAAFVLAREDGAILLRTRGAEGLLARMTEVPTTEWSSSSDLSRSLEHAPRLRGAKPGWRRVPGYVTHVFTHFPLQLAVYTATVSARTRAPEGMRWVPRGEIDGEALPSVMRKVVAHWSAFVANGGATVPVDVQQRKRGCGAGIKPRKPRDSRP